MPDNLKKKGPKDRKRQSNQSHEKKYESKRKTSGTKNKKK